MIPSTAWIDCLYQCIQSAVGLHELLVSLLSTSHYDDKSSHNQTLAKIPFSTEKNPNPTIKPEPPTENVQHQNVGLSKLYHIVCIP